MAQRFLDWMARKTLWFFATGLCRSLRIRVHDSSFFEEVQKHGKPCVVAFWHGAMVVGWYLHRPQTGGGVASLVSQSRDGEILSATLSHWGYAVIRGSSHIGGKEAMQMMVDALEQGRSLCVTPDGPTGPARRMKMGAVRAAQRTRVPLFLVGIGVDRKKKLRSWDQFEIPYPFSEVSARYSEAIVVPTELHDAGLEDFLARCEKRLRELTEMAERDLSGV